MTTLLRQLKLHALVGEKASTDPRIPLIIDYFDSLFDGMQIEIIPEYKKDIVVFHKGGILYMEQESGNGYLWCRMNGYWSHITGYIGLDPADTEQVIKYMVKMKLNHYVETPIRTGGRLTSSQAEKNLAKHIGTPNILYFTPDLAYYENEQKPTHEAST